MTGPAIKPDQTQGADPNGVPNIPRILSPDEFEQARMLSPDQLAKAKFPVLPPPFVPRDATNTGNRPQSGVDPTRGKDSAKEPEGGFSGILTRQSARLVGGIKEHPLATAWIIGAQFTPLAPLVDYGMASVMGKEFLDYAAQKGAEETLPPDIKAQAEQDPSRISGEDAGADALMMGAGAVAAKVAGARVAAAKVATETAKGKIAAHVDAIVDAANKMFAPANRSPEASGMANIMRATTGEQAAQYEQASFKLDEFRRAISPLPEADKLGFIDAIEGGKAQPTPEFQKAADTMRKIGDETWDHIVKLHPDAADSYLKNYFPHRWTDPEKAKIVFGGDKAPTPAPEAGPEIARPRTASGRLKALGKATPDELANEYAMAKGTTDANPALVSRLETELTKRGIDHGQAEAQGRATIDAQKPATGEAATVDPLEQAKREAGSKRQMAGSGNFLRERVIPTTADGIALGLEPVSTNPVDLFLLDLRNKQKFIMAHETMTQGKDAGFLKFFAGPMDAGYRPIDDKVATVFGPRSGAVALPEGANVAPEDVQVQGQRTMGRYGAPEPVATIINNYLSPGLGNNPIYQAYRGFGNTLNQAQLGLSAFHLGMTSIDATVSRFALGMEYLKDAVKNGDADAGAAALKQFTTFPFAPLSAIAQGTVGDLSNHVLATDFQWGSGAKVRAAYLNPEKATPEFQALANAVKEAGGRVRQDSFYSNSAPEKFMAAWHENDGLGMMKMALPAFFEATAKPLMEHVVPLQKLQVFGEMAKKVLGDLPPEATLADRRAAVASAWDSVDNRMGQLVYDNLFWSKTFKDLSMASVRSVGWNIGTIRELGGGVADLAKLTNEGELTHKTAYTVALPIVAGLYGAAYQYLRTGKGPEDLFTYFHPKTGEKDADGNDERVMLPTYIKDYYAYSGGFQKGVGAGVEQVGQTVLHKANPAIDVAAHLLMLTNKDFYGDEIRNPDDPAVKQVAQEAAWIAKQVEPFVFTNMSEQSKRADVSTTTKLGNWFGITPAKREDVRTKAQNDMADIVAKRGHSERTPEEVSASQARSDLLSGLRGNKNIDVQKALSDVLQTSQLSNKELLSLAKQAGLTPAQARFKSLTLAQAVKIFQEATPREKQMFGELLVKKAENATDKGSK